MTLCPIYSRIVIFSREHGCNISGNGRVPLQSDNDDACGAFTPSLSDAEADNRKSQVSLVCLNCGHAENADVNAAQNILGLGLQSVASNISTVLA